MSKMLTKAETKCFSKLVSFRKGRGHNINISYDIKQADALPNKELSGTTLLENNFS